MYYNYKILTHPIFFSINLYPLRKTAQPCVEFINLLNVGVADFRTLSTCLVLRS